MIIYIIFYKIKQNQINKLYMIINIKIKKRIENFAILIKIYFAMGQLKGRW